MSIFRRIMLGGGLDIDTLPDTQKLYYTATARVTLMSNSLGASLIANKWDPTTGEGIIVCAKDISKIGDRAFNLNTSLTSIIIPDSVTSMGPYAFGGCTSLESIIIPEGVTEIYERTFSDCSSLTSITIPNSVTIIGAEAFSYCKSLTSVTIGNSVTTIGDSAFSGCPSLTSVYCKATTPPSLDRTSVFDSNGSGRKIYVPMGSVDAYKSATNWSEYADAIEGYEF